MFLINIIPETREAEEKGDDDSDAVRRRRWRGLWSIRQGRRGNAACYYSYRGEYCLLPGLWLVQTDHVALILASDWSVRLGILEVRHQLMAQHKNPLDCDNCVSCIETCRIVIPAVSHIDTLGSPETGINFATNSQKCCKIYRELCLLLACQTSIQIPAIRKRYLRSIVWRTDEYNEQSLLLVDKREISNVSVSGE